MQVANQDQYQFEAVFEHATIGMIICDSEGKIIRFNKWAENQFGYKEQEIIGELIEILLPETLRTVHVNHRENFFKAPANRTMGSGRDLFARHKKGKVFPVEISISHYVRDGRNYAIAFIIDISVRKKNEAELQESSEKINRINSDLEQKVDSRTKMLRETLAELQASKEDLNNALQKERELGDLKSRFVTLASHEFRTPLSTISTSASIINKYTNLDDQPKREKHINRIKDAVVNMRDILEDFLSLGKLEEGQIAVSMEVYSREEIENELSRIVNSMDQLTKTRQVIHMNSKLNGPVRLDKKLTSNILSNLLSNAIKFSPEGSVISLTCELDNQYFNMEVSDNGIGISEEDQRHLFERFFRAKNASNIQGTGLGLNIVLKYLELMQGSIACKSRIDEGTTFTVKIPQPK